MTVTVQRKGLFQCYRDNKGPGRVILASDTPFPAGQGRGDCSRFAGAVPGHQVPTPVSGAGTPSAGLAVSTAHLSIRGIVFSR